MSMWQESSSSRESAQAGTSNNESPAQVIATGRLTNESQRTPDSVQIHEEDARNIIRINASTSSNNDTTIAANTSQTDKSEITASMSGNEDHDGSLVSTESFPEWNQFWTLLSPIPDGWTEFRCDLKQTNSLRFLEDVY